MILSGRPGVGKTLLAKAIAGEAKVPLYQITTEKKGEKDICQSITNVFSQAKENIPSIVFIDELDEIISNKNHYVSDITRSALKALLTEIDGISSSEGILVITTTNFFENLPEALIRSGRIDKHIHIKSPTFSSRIKIIEYYLAKSKKLNNIDAMLLARKTYSFTGADIKNLINETMLRNKIRGIENIQTKDFIDQIPCIVSNGIKLTQPKEVSDFTLYHELGHFVVNYELNNKSIASISVEKVGRNNGMISIDSDKDEEVDITKSVCLNNICIALAGYASEEYFMNETTMGCQNDLEKVSIIINSMTKCGMNGIEYSYSDDIYSVNENMETFNNDYNKLEDAEQKTNIKKRIYKEQLARAKTIINNHKDLINFLYPYLKKERKLESDEIEDLICKFEQK